MVLVPISIILWALAGQRYEQPEVRVDRRNTFLSNEKMAYFQDGEEEHEVSELDVKPFASSQGTSGDEIVYVAFFVVVFPDRLHPVGCCCRLLTAGV
jgi:hypothetical protein